MANWKRRRHGASTPDASTPIASRGDGLALARTQAGVRRLHALDERAGELGLFVGQKAADAVALAPGLTLAEADPAADAVALEALADACARFSPAVAVDPPDGLFLDITGLAHLWGGESALAADLTRRLARAGVPVRTAVAGGPGAAWALAHFGGAHVGEAHLSEAHVGGMEEETARLFPLPTAALRLAPEDAAQIDRLGLSTIGALAALPREQVARRVGPAVTARLDQVRGRAREALTFRRPPTPWFARLAFAEPISAPEDLARASADIARRLCALLEAHGQAARRFELGFHRLDGAVRRLSIGLALPGRDAGAIARLFAPKLETVDPGFGIEVVTLAADGAQALAPRQERLMGDHRGLSGLDEEAVSLAAPMVDRLANRLGEAAIWRAEPFPSHDPERAVSRRPALGPPLSAPPALPRSSASPAPVSALSSSSSSHPGPAPPSLGPVAGRPPSSRTRPRDTAGGPGGAWDPERPRPLRLLRPPEPIEAMAPVPDDPPVFFRWRGVPHRVRRAEGPERLAEEWWRRPFEDASPARIRDYYRVEDEAGMRFWLFRDGLYQAAQPPRWWLHGLFG
jgi:protein ImuB